MEHPPTSSALEDSALKFRLALEAAATEFIADATVELEAQGEADAKAGTATIESLRQRCEEANRLMTSYRVKAHALDRELGATRERLSKSRASHKAIIADLRAQIAELRGGQ